MTQHSPAPWREKAWYSGTILNSDGRIIAENVARNDMSVMIAAPELLAFTRSCFDAWLRGESLDAGSPQYDAARAVIAKAEGR